jgi:hypothetical protein
MIAGRPSCLSRSTNHHVVVAEQAESDARHAFHEAEQQAAQRG